MQRLTRACLVGAALGLGCASTGAAQTVDGLFEQATPLSYPDVLSHYIVSNRDVIGGTLIALKSYMVFDIPVGPRGQWTEECQALNRATQEPELFSTVLDEAEALFDERLQLIPADHSPGLFIVRQDRVIEPYDETAAMFPLIADQRRGIPEGQTFNISRENPEGERYCTLSTGSFQRLIRERDGAQSQFFDTNTHAFQVRMSAVEIAGIPVDAKRATALRRQALDRVVLEFVVQPDVTSFGRHPTVNLIPQAVRALHPETGELLYGTVLEANGLVEQSTSDSSAQEEMATTRPSSEALPLRSFYLDLLFAEALPDLIDPGALDAMAEWQVNAERGRVEGIAERIAHDQRLRDLGQSGLGLNLDNPFLAYTWGENDALAETISQLFVSEEADWSFAVEDPRVDPRFGNFIDVFVYGPDAVTDRVASFVVAENRQRMPDLIAAAAAHVPRSFVFQAPLRGYRYDFDEQAFRFTRGDAFVSSADLLLPIGGTPDIAETYYYSTSLASLPEGADRVANPTLYAAGSSAITTWRNSVDGLISGSGFGEMFAFNQRLSLSSIPMPAGQAEELIALNAALSVRFTVSLVEVEAVPPEFFNTRDPQILFRVQLQAADIVGPDGSVLHQIDTASFPTGASLVEQEEARTTIEVPTGIPSPSDGPLALTPQNLEMLVARFAPDLLTDELIEAFLFIRRAEEERRLRDGEDEIAGSIFIRREDNRSEVLPLPEGDALAALRASYRDNLLARASDLPADLEVLAQYSMPAQMSEGYWPGLGLGEPIGQLTASHCSRQRSFYERNFGPREAEAWDQACTFAERAGQIPVASAGCSNFISPGMTGLRWTCSDAPSLPRLPSSLGMSTSELFGLRLNLDAILRFDAANIGQLTTMAATTLNVRMRASDLSWTSVPPASSRQEAAEQLLAFMNENLPQFSGNPVSAEQPEALPEHWVLDVELLGAELVDDASGQTVAVLTPTAVPDLPVDLLAADQSDTDVATSASEGLGQLTLAGIALGMSFDEADAIIRSTFDVGEVLFADRAHSSRLTLDDEDAYTSGRLYLTADERQLIILYDEPPAASEQVVGLTIQYLVPNSGGVTRTLLSQLVGEYGEPDAITTDSFGYRPGESPLWSTVDIGDPDSPFGNSSYECMPASYWNFNVPRIWRAADGSEPFILTSGRFRRVPDIKGPVADHVSSRCGEIITATFDDQSFMPDIALNIWLMDPARYHRAFQQSRQMPPDLGTTSSEEAGGEEIVLPGFGPK